MVVITESSVKIDLKAWENKITKKLEVFYNPVMKFNRDCSILILNAYGKKDLQIGMPLSGSGIRGIRFLKELKKGKIKEINFNDYKEDFEKVLEKNLKLNNISKKDCKINIHNKEANSFLHESSGFDYIDVDPFGSPNPFLDFSARRISREGILAVTATDTSALAGTYPKACARKYWSVPLRNYLMHELGLRILIRKVQLIGAQHDKALIPVFCYAKDHYYRIFFRNEKGKKKVDEILKLHKYFLLDKELGFEVSKFNSLEGKEYAGPLWTGKLFDKKLVSKMKKEDYKKVIGSGNKEDVKFFEMLVAESKVDVVGLYDVHELVKKHKIKNNFKFIDLINALKKKKYKVVRTHFSKYGIKSDVGLKELLGIMKKV
ncbi:tRNA (guanine(10)-N(2))-dimethyltransferase [Candidatus Woesearchaeota archaeon]|jgi:tRNA (guanine26-N2/guanine27-N2)-dimethyltransferase|nr:tRNA (guanine(10)-N(2))-dimethyltransferase [Candidatus Woesearchaeota archaeon]MBT5272333.1 tRNA (guanine(10)-N(2))-dimethyltransferase [Candidatus Woesearchaeota archaeon]MBT6041263.1 tRNA (guanine(10)-N(2))-dimethyltransferase [Candidatus Woesearchaeota archaeon]MBT6336605.1 tRNA (guanine(10)-N(2))-dimethyltransferase [Candidatus Woesearchaeota archaeon]MBT7927495.1 tRNA (guanine(10)-N(2))-dimethyltransferase [Candidatus Woesearchaeota archaeon]